MSVNNKYVYRSRIFFEHIQTAIEILKEVETVKSRQLKRLTNDLSEVEFELQGVQNETEI
ncbi:MAG: hypothetical protein WD513_03355 [Balneolaceae bacterium]